MVNAQSTLIRIQWLIPKCMCTSVCVGYVCIKGTFSSPPPTPHTLAWEAWPPWAAPVGSLHFHTGLWPNFRVSLSTTPSDPMVDLSLIKCTTQCITEVFKAILILDIFFSPFLVITDAKACRIKCPKYFSFNDGFLIFLLSWKHSTHSGLL